MSNRTFTLVAGNDEVGRYTGATPKAAASKAFTKWVQGGGKSPYTFTIRETTQGSKKKQYTYRGERVKLNVATTYDLPGGKTITRKYKNVLYAQ